jgi:predicted MFS family arabinose efflux permease
MKRVGRRPGFMVGTAFAFLGGLVGALGVFAGSFWVLAAGTLLVGVASAFGQLYRFAAAEAAPPDWRSRAVSLVLAGGIAAGFVGPQIARATWHLLPTTYLASYLTVPLLALVTLALVGALRLPRPGQEAAVGGAARPVLAIVRQPVFIVAVVAEMMGYGVMNLIMTGTPLAMRDHHHSFADTAFVIEWHVLGMFAPGFFTGALVRRWGEPAIILLGIALNAAAVAAGFLDTGVWGFWLALTLVGIGWNFMFVAGSTLVTQAYRPAERAKAQGANDFLVFATVATTSVSSGQLLHHYGWTAVLLTAAPMLAAALLGAGWAVRRRRAVSGA